MRLRPFLGLLLCTGLVAIVTAVVPSRLLAASPSGRLWRIVTSVLVADHPVAASIAGFFVVGMATLALAGTRITVVAAAVGHVGSALSVYAALALAHETVTTPDYGTSAVVAAWIGVVGALLWQRNRRASAVAFVVVSAAVGWACKNTLTILDTEHAVALGAGVAVASLRTMIGWPGKAYSTSDARRSMPVAISDSSTMLNDSRSSFPPLPSE